MKHRRTDPTCEEYRPPFTPWGRRRHLTAAGRTCEVCNSGRTVAQTPEDRCGNVDPDEGVCFLLADHAGDHWHSMFDHTTPAPKVSITLRDIDNRDDDGAPYQFTGTVDQVINYLDGAVRRDLRDPDAPWLKEAIRLVRRGDVAGASTILGCHAAVYLATGGTQ